MPNSFIVQNAPEDAFYCTIYYFEKGERGGKGNLGKKESKESCAINRAICVKGTALVLSKRKKEGKK